MIRQIHFLEEDNSAKYDHELDTNLFVKIVMEFVGRERKRLEIYIGDHRFTSIYSLRDLRSNPTTFPDL